MIDEILDLSLSGEELKFQLDGFSGPLDLLLSMVKEARIEIKDIFISNITDQFLAYMAALKKLDIDLGSEYMEITATLLEIKSRSLLPAVEEDYSLGEETPEQEIIRRLDEFRILKEASEKLREIENVDRFYKQPDLPDDINYAAKDMSIEKLLAAYTEILIRNKIIEEGAGQDEKEIEKDAFTVAQKMKRLQELLRENDRLSFFALFSEKASKREIIVTFSALLELMKLQYVKIEQNGEFQDITLEKNPDYEGSEELDYDGIDVG